MSQLHTARLLLRDWRDDDLEAFAALNSDPEVMRWFRAPLSRSESDEFAGRIRSRLREDGWGLWAVEVVGAEPFVGFVGLARQTFEAAFTPCVEVGWRLARPVWGCGYAPEAARTVVDFAFGTLGLADVVSITTAGNVKSRRVMEKLGMTYDPGDDFDHPSLEIGHPFRPHVLYRLANPHARVAP